jgi:ABC-type transport system involved in cytochrome c biogenesis permease subunit
MDVLFAPEKAAEDYKPFRVDYPDLAASIAGSQENEKFFSLNQILAHWDELGDQIMKASAAREDGRKLTIYQDKLLDLASKLKLYFKTAGPDNVESYRAFHVEDPKLRQALKLPADRSLYSIGDLRNSADGQGSRMLSALLSDEAANREEIAGARAEASRLMDSIDAFSRMCPAQGLRSVPPVKQGDDWQSPQRAAAMAEQEKVGMPQAVASYAELRQAYEANLPSRFNKVAGAFYADLERQVPRQADKASFEARFNFYDPFMKCIVFYIAAFVLVCLSWLFEDWQKLLYRSAAALIGVALVVHTAGLVGRIYISGRPPVTNLTSASIFIAWGALLMALGVEYFFRNSMGLLVAAVAGFGSLFLSEALTVTEGDTLKVLQAVLDTNFWLATHVTCVTLGYAATILAGLLGIVYVVRGLFTDSLDKEDGKEIARMTYGVACFAMFFSFVGTVLGGIWADQSWGRFWGWDSKENGAVLVVLTNAILLHARWGGLVRERGIAVLAIWGIMVTQWSFFGTNQLGVGLHAYGFTEGLWGKLLLFWGIELAFLAMGLVPMKYWASYQEAGASTPAVSGNGARSAMASSVS